MESINQSNNFQNEIWDKLQKVRTVYDQQLLKINELHGQIESAEKSLFECLDEEAKLLNLLGNYQLSFQKSGK